MRMHAKQECIETSQGAATATNPWAPEHLPPLELAQVVEDCLFAFVNAQSAHSREMMWPMLVETVEALVADFRQRFGQEQGRSDPER